MEAMTFVLDDRAWTREERDSLPPDGSRHELLDGALIVTPSPGVPHQRMVFALGRAHDRACPSHLEVFTAPLDVTLAADTVLEPSLTAWELRDGRYVEVAHVTGEQSWSATLPFPVTISPAQLLA